jgi:membrane protease YdiL (CAAX protease family)
MPHSEERGLHCSYCPNSQLLMNLGPLDVLLVALASGVPEELLFRGALLPASFPDWRGAALSAALFGALHVSGGRNAAFALWAAGVGGVYGAAMLATGSVWVPAAAHVAANAASAFVWKARAGTGGK